MSLESFQNNYESLQASGGGSKVKKRSKSKFGRKRNKKEKNRAHSTKKWERSQSKKRKK